MFYTKRWSISHVCSSLEFQFRLTVNTLKFPLILWARIISDIILMFIRCVFIITVKNYPRVIPKDTSHTIQKNLCQHVFLKTGLTNVKCCVATKKIQIYTFCLLWISLHQIYIKKCNCLGITSCRIQSYRVDIYIIKI